jgi:alpha-beta hydrolase superfamily lysophospholipase
MTSQQLDEPGQPSLETFTSSDGYRWHYRKFTARTDNGQPRGRVIFIHGIQSHGGWYTRSCAEISGAGYEVYFLDRRGSGLNTEKRGDMPSFRRVIDDFAEFIRFLPQDGLPKIFGAISWGGKLGIALQYRHPGLVDGLALLCPGIASKVRPSLLTRAQIALARVFRPDKHFPIPLSDPNLFTSSPQWQKFISEDQLGLRVATARMLFGSFALDIYLKRAWKQVNVPVLLLLAEKDRIVHNVDSWEFVRKFPTEKKQVIEYWGAHHTLEFEPEGHKYLDDLLKWMEMIVAERPSPKAVETSQSPETPRPIEQQEALAPEPASQEPTQATAEIA